MDVKKYYTALFNRVTTTKKNIQNTQVIYNIYKIFRQDKNVDNDNSKKIVTDVNGLSVLIDELQETFPWQHVIVHDKSKPHWNITTEYEKESAKTVPMATC